VLSKDGYGNYWSDYDSIEEGCNDVNDDNICDEPFLVQGYDTEFVSDPFPVNKKLEYSQLNLPGNQWSLISFPFLPNDKTLETVFGESLDFISVIKTGNCGDFQEYNPGEGLYELTHLDYKKSYSIHPSQNIKHTVAGFETKFPLNIEIPACVNDEDFYLAYPYNFETDIEQLFAPIIDKVVIIKSQDQFYIPGVGGELTTLEPGKGYKIVVNEDVNFTYPSYCIAGVLSGQCSGYRYCLGGQFVSWGCDVCGCPEGKTCEKIDAVWKCTGPDLPPRLG
jgi:hypothetical protein